MFVRVPAPRDDRWYELQISGMVGQQLMIDGRRWVVLSATPLDGTPEDGASMMVLEVG